MPPLLIVENLRKTHGSLVVIDDLSFSVGRGEILGLMGPNGAGKTTLFDLLTGLSRPDRGRVVFKGRDITRMRPALRCRLGMGRTYQIPRPFARLSVLENILVAAVHGAGLSQNDARVEAGAIMERIGLGACGGEEAGGLPLFARRRLELGRALAGRPDLLLLDEIAGGLSENEVREVMGLTREAQARGAAAIVIEHRLTVMAEGIDRLLVIAGGRRLECGTPGEVLRSPEVLACYLGDDHPW